MLKGSGAEKKAYFQIVGYKYQSIKCNILQFFGIIFLTFFSFIIIKNFFQSVKPSCSISNLLFFWSYFWEEGKLGRLVVGWFLFIYYLYTQMFFKLESASAKRVNSMWVTVLRIHIWFEIFFLEWLYLELRIFYSVTQRCYLEKNLIAKTMRSK